MEKNTTKLSIFLAILLVIFLGSFLYLAKLQQPQTSVDQADNKNNTNTNKINTSTRGKKKTDTSTGKISKSKLVSELSTPGNIEIDFVTDELPEVTDIEVGPTGNLWATRPASSSLSLVELNENREAEDIKNIFDDLDNPQSIAFHPQKKFELFITEGNKISKLTTFSEKSSKQKVVDLPEATSSYKTNLTFDSKGNLLVAIGSPCDFCNPDNSKFGAIQQVNTSTGEMVEYARGLKSVGSMELHEIDGSLWASESNVDASKMRLPDEVNKIEQDQDYGWPDCFGEDISFSKSETSTASTSSPKTDCSSKQKPSVVLDSMVNPEGMDFVPEEGWPEKYWYDMIVAQSGSENSYGYEASLARVKFNDQVKPQDRRKFITGWSNGEEEALGKPTDIELQPGGIGYIADKKRGAIYKISYQGDLESSTTTASTSTTTTTNQ
jgi:glucose/arabinose dehydrogenase